MKYEPRDYQQTAIEKGVDFFRNGTGGNGILVLPTGCHAKGYEIMMYDGTLKKVEDINVGDVVMGDNCTPRNVLRLHRGRETMYRITPNKGVPFVVNGGHILHLQKTDSRKPSFREISVKEYIAKSENFKHHHKLHRGIVTYFPQSEALTIDPYFLGLLLGDGSLHETVSITTMRDEVRDFIYDYCFIMGWGVNETRKAGSKATSYNIRGFNGRKRGRYEKTPLRLFLEKNGLFGKNADGKFIPRQYLTASIYERRELLAGFLDTDSYYDHERNIVEYCTKSLQLAKDVQFLCRSLGLFCGNPMDKVVNDETYYRFFISGDLNEIPNLVEIRKGAPRSQKRNVFVTGFSVEELDEDDYYGFELDNNHLYLDWQFLVHHNSGKSYVISSIADRLGDNLLVFQPSKEILEQNLASMKQYTDDCSAYSASVGEKKVSKITFATIGSVKEHIDEFKHFKYVCVDECHFVSADNESGMYFKFLSMLNCRVLGLTATPFRLYSDTKFDLSTRKTRSVNARLLMLPQVPNPFFTELLYVVQNREMFDKGYLATPSYYPCRPPRWNEDRMFTNSMGSDYSEKSIQWMMEFTDMTQHIINVCRRLLHPKTGVPRKGILVFTQFVEDAEEICAGVADSAFVCGTTTKKNRERIIQEFREGKIKVLVNCNALATGFNVPSLDTVVLGRPTLSLALYLQQMGRVVRKFDGKDAWVVDCVGNVDRFGRMEDIFVGKGKNGKDEIFGYVKNKQSKKWEWKQLTGVPLKPQEENLFVK